MSKKIGSIEYYITIAIFIEIVGISILTALLTSDYGTDEGKLLGGYTIHRVIVMCISYIIAVYQAGFAFGKKMVRPEIVLFNTLKTTVYLILVASFLFIIATTKVLHYEWILKSIPLIYILLSASRLSMRGLIRRSRAKGRNTSKVCMFGDFENLQDIYSSMSDSSHGYKIIGYFNDCADPNYPAEISYLGKESDFFKWFDKTKDKGLNSVYFAPKLNNTESIKKISAFCDNNLIHFYCIPAIKNVINRPVFMTRIGNTPLLTLHREPLTSVSARFIKRTFDICFSALFLVTLFPVVLLIFGTWIKLSSRGPIFFRQKRSGIDNREFYCLKFRSMQVNKDADSKQATKGDSRVTRVGQLMRKTSVDELPQFINVLLGDMSIVGPRPHMVKHTSEYSALIDKYMVRHFVKPGITGWAQVTGFRGETNELWQMEERIKKDIWYIEHWSFFLDIVIIFKTILNAIKGEEKAY